ncbi:ABC transporter substrate-binding protein [Bombiscardovia nodaiensis]|uniref:ABC transporter substrate-binding protein n=1 Tax=Bombiscardovia nodaiensis TaxID=2932181 RepID=A0ABM8B6Z0_9BIFI|nr:ABC transporter substrate-binding protein [Bombiscardovia nodaiensis]
MRKHRLATLAAAVIIPVMALSACGSAQTGNTASPSSGSAASEGEQTVTFWYSSAGHAVDTINDLVSKFNADHKGKITVKASYQGNYTDVQQKFSAAVQSKSTPSIMQMNDIATAFMIDSKQTTPIYELAKGDKSFDGSSIPKAARKYYSDSKGLLSLPMSVSEPTMYINKQLATQAGLDVSNPPKTFDDVVQWANTIHEKTGAYGYSQYMSDSWIFEMLSANGGLEICNPDNGQGSKQVTGITMTKDLQVKTFQKIADMFKSGVGLNNGTRNTDVAATFSANKLGLALSSSAAYTVMGPSSNVIIAPFPKISDSKKAGTPIGGNSLWVIKGNHSEAEQKASYEFGKYLMSPHAQAVFAKSTGYLFANEKAAQEPEGKEMMADPNIKVLYKQLEDNPASNASLGCRAGAFPLIRKDVIGSFNDALNGTDMKSAMKAAEDKAATDITSYNKAARK